MTELMDVDTNSTQTDAPATEPVGWVSPTGDFGEGAPENIRNILEKKKWTNITQMADGYSELERFKGSGEHIVIPEADDAEGWRNIFNKAGRPETYDKYNISYEGEVPIGDELIGQFKQFSHGLDLTQKQFDGVVKFQLDAVAAQEEVHKTQQAERDATNVQAMKQKWGEQYDPTYAKVEATAEKLGVASFFKEMGIINEPEIVNMLLTVSNSDAEGTLLPSGAPVATKTPQQEIEDIKQNPAYTDKFHQDHKAMVQRVMELSVQIANAGQGRAPKSR